ncbi:DJ-1/PfpI family protein [Thalassospira marina]|uniref:AraC family transcriptional regulator n=1 Tax=Thalassospira marina TaxID=2048283 RepID=A0ABM6QGA8_9PROT|nr:DJ-1/PfpI family protein [Thalassospira marina]AUG55648.1 AraC family transcriptional regulator [Thalassospira marina]
MIAPDQPLTIGSLIFDGMDQIDFTGPFEVLSRVPNATFHIGAKTAGPVADTCGLRLLADKTLAEMPMLDILHVPGGPGQEALMDDEEVLGFIRRQAENATCVFSVCTGTLLCGAAGLLVGRRATTHWAALDVLPHFGAITLRDRVVRDGKFLFAGGVTSGIDGALQLVADLRGAAAAMEIQLYMQYQPEPPFDSGTPERAPADILGRARNKMQGLTAKRIETAKRVASQQQIPYGRNAG